MNGSMTDSDPFGNGLSPGVGGGGPPITPDWGNNDAFAAAFDSPFTFAGSVSRHIFVQFVPSIISYKKTWVKELTWVPYVRGAGQSY